MSDYDQQPTYQFHGRKLRSIRTRRFWSQQELADRARVSKGHISRIEAGVHTPHLSTVRKLARALGVDPDVFVEWDSEDGQLPRLHSRLSA